MVAPIKVIILKETLHKANLFLEGPKEVDLTFDVVVACQSQQQLYNFTSNVIGFDYNIQLSFRFLVFDLTYLYYGWSNTIVFV